MNRGFFMLHPTADGGGTPPPTDNPNPTDTPPAEPPKPKSFGELLKSDQTIQAEFDSRVNKAVETAHKKWEEAQRLTEDQRKQKEREEREREFEEREATLKYRELRADTIAEIGKRGLPADLIEAIDMKGEKADAIAHLNKVEAAFRKAVSDAVDAKLKGNPPPAGGGAPVGKKQQLIDEYNAAEKKGDVRAMQQIQAKIKALKE